MKIFFIHTGTSDDEATVYYFDVAWWFCKHILLSGGSGIAGGPNWKYETEQKIKEADICFALITSLYPKSLKAHWETLFALESSKVIVPVMHEGAKLPPLLSQFQYIDLVNSNYDDWTKEILDYVGCEDQIEDGEKRNWSFEPDFSDDRFELFEQEKVRLERTSSNIRVFIAYSHKQKTIAEELSELLLRNGKAIFWDAKIKAGATWRQTIQKALDDATHLIVIWTPDAAESDEVEREVSYALAHQKVIVPLLSQEIPKLPYHLHGLHYIVLEDDLNKIEADLLKAIAQFSDAEDIWQ